MSFALSWMEKINRLWSLWDTQVLYGFFFFFGSLIIPHSILVTHHSSLKIPQFPNSHPFGNCFHFTSLNYFYCFLGPTHWPKEDFSLPFFFFSFFPWLLHLSLPLLFFFLFFFCPSSFSTSPELFSAFSFGLLLTKQSKNLHISLARIASINGILPQHQNSINWQSISFEGISPQLIRIVHCQTK